jgi:hypothetical protein
MQAAGSSLAKYDASIPRIYRVLNGPFGVQASRSTELREQRGAADLSLNTMTPCAFQRFVGDVHVSVSAALNDDSLAEICVDVAIWDYCCKIIVHLHHYQVRAITHQEGAITTILFPRTRHPPI